MPNYLAVITLSLSLLSHTSDGLAAENSDISLRNIKLGMTMLEVKKYFKKLSCKQVINKPRKIYGTSIPGAYYGSNCREGDDISEISIFFSPNDKKVWLVQAFQNFPEEYKRSQFWLDIKENFGNNIKSAVLIDRSKMVRGKVLENDIIEHKTYGGCVAINKGRYTTRKNDQSNDYCIGIRYKDFVVKDDNSKIKRSEIDLVKADIEIVSRTRKWYYEFIEKKKFKKNKLKL